jgi:hypothetical protein
MIGIVSSDSLAGRFGQGDVQISEEILLKFLRLSHDAERFATQVRGQWGVETEKRLKTGDQEIQKLRGP